MNTTSFGTLPCKDLLSVAQLAPGDVGTIFDTAATLKSDRNAFTSVLANKRLGMIFEKDSLRTRFTFDVGMQDLGGSAVFMDHRDVKLGSRESLKDMAKNLERWVHGIVARTYKHRALEELAANCNIPVINGLSDYLHPCQGLADVFTLHERWGDVKGRKLVYVGDGNNTCHSLVHTCALLGAHITVCTPEGFEPNSRVISEGMLMARESGSDIVISNDPEKSVAGADAVYTDVWASMGQEDEIEERAALFESYRVDEELMALAKPDAFFMHCLPAHRGQEVTSPVIDGPNSIVYDIAENRLHVQKAVLALLMG
ncbi:MAG: ornithine carbamoyltransferase [Planctomycetota bacterium]|nr:ornithine carbamoyltransferase [Planctomycetota bacterium]